MSWLLGASSAPVHPRRADAATGKAVHRHAAAVHLTHIASIATIVLACRIWQSPPASPLLCQYGNQHHAGEPASKSAVFASNARVARKLTPGAGDHPQEGAGDVMTCQGALARRPAGGWHQAAMTLIVQPTTQPGALFSLWAARIRGSHGPVDRQQRSGSLSSLFRLAQRALIAWRVVQYPAMINK